MTSWLVPALAIYLAIGLVAAVVGPFAREVRRSMPPLTETAEFAHEFLHGELPARWRRILGAIVIYAGAILFAPIVYIPYWLEERSREGDLDDALGLNIIDPDDTCLYFSQIGGAGTLACQHCGHREEIVAFLHGHGTLWCKTGLQCQTCGRLCTFERLEDGTGVPDFCACSGEPSRDDPLFCPACRSTDLDYLMSYIT